MPNTHVSSSEDKNLRRPKQENTTGILNFPSSGPSLIKYRFQVVNICYLWFVSQLGVVHHKNVGHVIWDPYTLS